MSPRKKFISIQPVKPSHFDPQIKTKSILIPAQKTSHFRSHSKTK